MITKNNLLSILFNAKHILLISSSLLFLFIGGICIYFATIGITLSVSVVYSLFEDFRDAYFTPNYGFFAYLLALAGLLSPSKIPYTPKEKNISKKVKRTKKGNSETDNVVTLKHYIPE